MRRALPLAALLAGCAMGTSYYAGPARPVEAVPAAFAVDTTFHRPGTAPGAGACLARLVDPSDGTRLQMVQSRASDADYRVTPEGAYGLRAGELLRVECATLAPRGAVPAP